MHMTSANELDAFETEHGIRIPARLSAFLINRGPGMYGGVEIHAPQDVVPRYHDFLTTRAISSLATFRSAATTGLGRYGSWTSHAQSRVSPRSGTRLCLTTGARKSGFRSKRVGTRSSTTLASSDHATPCYHCDADFAAYAER
jgi:hypothetical protein